MAGTVFGIDINLLAALINNIAIPELLTWLASLRASGATVITEADALAKLGMDVDSGNAAGKAAIDAHSG